MPGRQAVSSAGVFLVSGGGTGGDPALADRLTDRSSVTLLIVPPATFGLPKIRDRTEEEAVNGPALASLIMNVAALAAMEDTAVPLTARKVFLRALADKGSWAARLRSHDQLSLGLREHRAHRRRCYAGRA